MMPPIHFHPFSDPIQMKLSDWANFSRKPLKRGNHLISKLKINPINLKATYWYVGNSNNLCSAGPWVTTLFNQWEIRINRLRQTNFLNWESEKTSLKEIGYEAYTYSSLSNFLDPVCLDFDWSKPTRLRKSKYFSFTSKPLGQRS